MDANAKLSADDHFNPKKHYRPSVEDTSFRDFFNGSNNWYDTAETIANRSTATHFTFESNNSLTDLNDTTKTRIDYILTKSSIGVCQQIIDNVWDPLNKLGINHGYGKGNFGDHVPVTLIINLLEWDGALMPEKHQQVPITKIKFPNKTHENFSKVKDLFAQLDDLTINITEMVGLVADHVEWEDGF